MTSKTKRSKSSTPTPTPTPPNTNHQDDDISSGSDSENGHANGTNENDHGDNESELSSDEEFADETVNDKRRRLAKQYLENLKQNEHELYDEFDAKDLDDDILARRLQKTLLKLKDTFINLSVIK